MVTAVKTLARGTPVRLVMDADGHRRSYIVGIVREVTEAGIRVRWNHPDSFGYYLYQPRELEPAGDAQ